MTIEEKIEQLDLLLKEIEDPKTGLETSVEKYNQASEIIKQCYAEIKKCDGKIVEINENLNMVDFNQD